MNKKAWGGKIAAFILGLGCIVYIGARMVSGLGDRIQTIEAALVSVEDKFSASGVFIRDEQPIYGDSSKTVEYSVANGEKVSNGQSVAMFFSDTASLTAYHEMLAVEDEIESLQYAYTHLSGGADGAKLDSLITISMLSVTKQLEQGSVQSAASDYADLLQLVLRRDGERITNSEYTAQLSALESERASWQQQAGSGATVAAAPAAGYFVRYYDGLSEALDPDNLDSLTVDEVEAVLENEETHTRDGVIGGLVQDFEWYFATVVSEEQGAVLRERSTVNIRFPAFSDQLLRVNVHDVRTSEDGQALVIFQCNEMNESCLTTRQAEIEIIYQSFDGIMVPREALRQVDGQWGVYCLVGGVTRFKPVEWVYQTDSYYLVEPAASSSGGLVMYDQIIVSGKDLEKDKVVR